MYPTSTNTPAGCSGNRQSRSIGEDGGAGSNVTPRVPLYMDIIPCLYTSKYVIPELNERVRNKPTSRNISLLQWGMALWPP